MRLILNLNINIQNTTYFTYISPENYSSSSHLRDYFNILMIFFKALHFDNAARK